MRDQRASRSVERASMASRSGRSSSGAVQRCQTRHRCLPPAGRVDTVRRRQPGGEGLGGAVDEGQDGLAPEGAGGLLVVGIGVVAGDAEQHRRHADRERDLAGGDVLGLDEVHVLGRERHRLPVEAAFEQQRPAGAGGALEALLQLGLEAVVLFGREVAVAGGVDEGAGGPRGVVEQRLVPARGGVVDVDRRAAASMGLMP